MWVWINKSPVFLNTWAGPEDMVVLYFPALKSKDPSFPAAVEQADLALHSPHIVFSVC